MRRANKVDRNQGEIVKALRQAGFNVWDTHDLGHGFPDILVGAWGANYLMEIKMPGEPLTDDELRFHQAWGGVKVVHSVEEAIDALAY